MKKNFMLLICIISLIAVALASCEKDCDHTFSDKWNNDANNHWHPATCEHAETERSEFGSHVDANEDGLCDVCSYEIGHVHTFEDAWTKTETHHWKNSTCSHTDAKDGYSTHSDEDVNGVCDVCEGHVHNVNAAGYCKFADCGKKVRDIDENSLDELVAAILVQKHLVNGGIIDYTFDGKSNTGTSYYANKQDLVSYTYGKNNYTHIFVNTYNLNEGINTLIPVEEGISPVIGENGNWWIGDADTGVKANDLNTPTKGDNNTWIIGGTERRGTLETWYQLVGVDNVFGIVSENGGDYTLDLPDVAKLNGHYISMSTLVGEYGVEELLYALYEVAIGDTTNELEVIPDTAENKVTFKYNYKTVFVNETEIAVGDNPGSKVYNVNYFEVEVTFMYNDDFALTDLMILVDCYTNDPGTADGYGFLYPDVDILYDPKTDSFTFVEYVKEDGEWVAKPTDKRTPDTYIINVTQTIGERTEENPNPKSKFTPESFEIYLDRDEETGVLSNKYEGDVIEAQVSDIINLYIGDCTPVGTSIHFVADQVSVKLYKNNVEVQNPDDYLNQVAVAMLTFSGEQRSFFIIPKEEGSYRFEIYLMGEKTHEITIHVGVIDEEFIELGENEFAVKINESYAWTNEVIFTATETGTYYFNLPAGIGFINADEYDAAQETEATDDGPTPYFDYNTYGNENGGSFHLALEEGESIRFYVNGIKRGTVVISYVVF